MSKLVVLGIVLTVIGAFVWIRAQQVLDDYQDQRNAVGGLGGVFLDFGDALDPTVDLDEEVTNRRNARNVGIGLVVVGGTMSVYAIGRQSSRQ